MMTIPPPVARVFYNNDTFAVNSIVLPENEFELEEHTDSKNESHVDIPWETFTQIGDTLGGIPNIFQVAAYLKAN